ncbi:sensor histidine kinase [Paenibacillus nanensis]|uniref:Sensor histidine kinase n=1 Tax=Paenibacillus nanensis TaxID=393251 RepID=A0A3A1VJZ1_9BACL|nr:sensor histidine kinase [Paenibacillus nanensis]RIX60565.1 sensor histidine kinase [Paenibacillus nanensis]
MRPIHLPLRNMPLQRKLLALIVPLLIVTVSLTGLYSYVIASREVVDKIRQAQLNMAVKTKDQLDHFAQNSVSFTNYLFLNKTVQEMVGSGDTPSRRDMVFKSLLPLMVTGETIQSLILYAVKDNSTASSPFAITQTGIASAISYDRFKETPYYERLVASPSNQLWDILRPEDNVLTGDSHYKLVYITLYKNHLYQPVGLLIAGMDADKLSRNLFHDNTEDAVQFMMNDEGVVLAATDTAWIGLPVSELPVFGMDGDVPANPAHALDQLKARSDLIVSDSVSDITGWHSVVIQDRSKLVLELREIGSATVSITVIVCLLAIVMSWMIARYVTNPMKKLMHSMKALQIGDFSQRVDIVGNDEFGRLGYLYNSMVGRIKALIHDVYASSLKQREAELKALQSQINPHFLYNTLNMINWSALQKGDKDISEMVVALSQVFRLSLNSGNEFVALSQEIELLRHYLFLQKKRYPSRLYFDIEVDPALHHFRMPKLLLQPLVENAIIYSIEQAEGTGNIFISAYREDGWIRLEVTDNGPGMPEELVQQLNRTGTAGAIRQAADGTRSGMAIANIKERLSLFYKEAAFEIISKEGIGTRAIVRIKEGDQGHDA